MSASDRNLKIGIGVFIGIAWILGLVLATRSDRSRAQKDAQESVERMQEFADEMCQCADPRCVDQVTQKMTKWGTEMAKHAGKTEKPDPETAAKLEKLTSELTKCITKAMARTEPQ